MNEIGLSAIAHLQEQSRLGKADAAVRALDPAALSATLSDALALLDSAPETAEAILAAYVRQAPAPYWARAARTLLPILDARRPVQAVPEPIVPLSLRLRAAEDAETAGNGNRLRLGNRTSAAQRNRHSRSSRSPVRACA